MGFCGLNRSRQLKYASNKKKVEQSRTRYNKVEQRCWLQTGVELRTPLPPGFCVLVVESMPYTPSTFTSFTSVPPTTRIRSHPVGEATLNISSVTPFAFDTSMAGGLLAHGFAQLKRTSVLYPEPPIQKLDPETFKVALMLNVPRGRYLQMVGVIVGGTFKWLV
jgi:hypothetical protein